MVKKDAPKGKNDKAAGKDTFDPLIIEAGQAGTVVLMLDSAEEDVVIKASEALYKFVQKCDVNKALVMQLEAVPRLLRLIASDNRQIRRNACLVLGSMSAEASVTNGLRKLDVIPQLIKLLGPDEETVVNEYAALSVIALSHYYTCKRTICELNGIEPLIRCLSLSDPDVQKNCIEAISLLLQDFDAKTALRELNGFLPVLELLKSEYAAIQSLALKVLHLAAEDGENRAALRNTSLINDMIGIVLNPSLNDLHVSAVVVLNNMFQDLETIQVMKDNGSLKKLISVAMDIPPVVEEEKKPKAKEKDKVKPGSKMGKKGKTSTAEPEKQKSEPKPVVFEPLGLEVKEQIGLAFWRAAKNADSRRLLNELEIEKAVISLLRHCSARVQVAAAGAVQVLAENLVSRDLIGKLGGIEELVKMLCSSNITAQEAAVRALSILTASNEFNCNEILKKCGIRPLISLVTSEEPAITEYSVVTLINMNGEEAVRAEILQCDVIPALVTSLPIENPAIQCKIATAIGLFVTDAPHRKQFVESCGVVPLVDLLNSCVKEVRSSGTWAIAALAADEPTADVMCQRGALDILRHMEITEELSNPYVELAICKLMNCSLSAKYSLTGRLCASDIIRDGFFDVGHRKAGKPLLPLSHYYCEPINHKRPIFYVNTGLDKEASHSSSCDSVSFECQPSCEPPVDCELACIIEEARACLLPLQFASAAERAIAVAQIVSNHMGGPIDKGNFTAFSWELSISELKCSLNSNVIPLGSVTAGIYYHRALLFKVVGDRVGVYSSLVRGDFNRAWNELALSDCYEDETPVRFPPKTYIIDLVFQPGRLMRTDSADAAMYCNP